jgi:hypothetical protein
VLGASGLVVAGIGAVLTADSLIQASSLSDECGTLCAPDRWGKFRTMQIVGDAMLAAGGAAVIGAVVWWAFTPRSGAPEQRAWIAPGAGGFVVGGTL